MTEAKFVKRSQKDIWSQGKKVIKTHEVELEENQMLRPTLTFEKFLGEWQIDSDYEPTEREVDGMRDAWDGAIQTMRDAAQQSLAVDETICTCSHDVSPTILAKCSCEHGQ